MSQLKVDTITDEEGTGAPDFPNGATLDGAAAYSRDNILGTVAQADGVPTGAIIERGSNANGKFVRYADGTMICWGSLPPSTTEITSGNVFRSDSQTQDFPAVFASGDVCSSVSSTGIVRWANSTSSTGTSSLTYRVFGSISSETGLVGRYKAIGRWF
jgi:hypothetical protein